VQETEGEDDDEEEVAAEEEDEEDEVPDAENEMPAVDEAVVEAQEKQKPSEKSTPVWIYIVPSVVGGVMIVAGIIGAVVWRRRRARATEKSPLLPSGGV